MCSPSRSVGGTLGSNIGSSTRVGLLPLWNCPSPRLAAQPLDHFRNLQHRIHFRAHPPQLPFLLQPAYKLPQIPIRHSSPPVAQDVFASPAAFFPSSTPGAVLYPLPALSSLRHTEQTANSITNTNTPIVCAAVKPSKDLLRRSFDRFILAPVYELA